MTTSKNPHWRTNSVYSSEPVTKFPTVHNEGITSPELAATVNETTFSVTPDSMIKGMVDYPASDM